MESRTLENWLSLSGAAAFVFYFLHVFLGQRGYPGYSWTCQAVSPFGILERFSVFSVVIFTLILGIFGFTLTPKAQKN